MAQAHKRGLVFLAEYGVIFQITLFILSCFHEGYFSLWWFLVGSVTVLSSLLVASLVKRIIKKKRPSERKEMFIPFGEYAFPSGHATGMTVVSLLIFISGGATLGALSLLVSACVMSARVDAHVHDWFDMIGGILLGVISVYVASTVIA